jgi:hypothetical protein
MDERDMDTTRLNGKDGYDACMRLAEFFAKRNDGRRSYEWKVTLGLWALLVGAIRYKKDVQALPAWLHTWLFFAVGLIYAFLWLRPLADSHRNDKIMSIYYRELAQAFLPLPSFHKKKTETAFCRVWFCAFGFLCNWYLLFQLVTTVFLCFVAWWLIN